MKWFTRFPVLIMGLALAASNLPAFNHAGHMTIGAIAYQELKANHPETLARVVALLKEHPDYADRWLTKIQSSAVGASNEDLYLFMAAARWPDDIRSDPDEHHGEWHYINYPYKPAGEPGWVKTQPPQDENIVVALGSNRTATTDAFYEEDRAKALCWVFHLVGDIHQPLHTTALFSKVFPKGDKGGNAFLVKPRSDRAPINLHKLWDGLVLGSQRFQSVVGEATRLRQAYPRNGFPQLATKDIEVWAKDESFGLALSVAYSGLAQARTEASARTVPGGYLDKATGTAESQATLAGYRLADMLVSLFP